MRKSMHLVTVVATLVMLLGAATANFGQRVGGYSKIATDDPGVTAAADFAVEAQKKKTDGPLSLTEILQAERQTVAGTNYHLCMGVKAGDEDDAGVESWFVDAVVFEKLPRAPGDKYQLTSWKKVKGCDD